MLSTRKRRELDAHIERQQPAEELYGAAHVARIAKAVGLACRKSRAPGWLRDALAPFVAKDRVPSQEDADALIDAAERLMDMPWCPGYVEAAVLELPHRMLGDWLAYVAVLPSGEAAMYDAASGKRARS